MHAPMSGRQPLLARAVDMMIMHDTTAKLGVSHTVYCTVYSMIAVAAPPARALRAATVVDIGGGWLGTNDV